ncbi:MAG: hypothetical protein WCL00_07385 [Bacteroidota bacterium]
MKTMKTMKTMKRINLFLGTVSIIIILCGCNSNSKLSQSNAEKAINQFTSVGNKYFKISSVKSIGTLSQFSDNEANTALTFGYTSSDAFGNSTQGDIQVKCIFKKNVDKKWIFTSIEPITSFMDWNGYYKWIQNSQDMNIIAQ